MVQPGRVLIVRDYEIDGEDGGDGRRVQNRQHLESHVDLKLGKDLKCVAVHLAGTSFFTWGQYTIYTETSTTVYGPIQGEEKFLRATSSDISL
jgi:hypothetical protein